MLVKILKRLIKKRKFRRKNFKKHTVYLYRKIFNECKYLTSPATNKRYLFNRKIRLLNSYTLYQNKKNILRKPFLQNLSKNNWLKHLSTYNTNTKLIYISIIHKTDNIKCTISNHKHQVKQTISIGSVLKYFKIATSKIFRRNLKGTGLFLNFLKLILNRKYREHIPVLSIVGFNFNLLMLRRQLRELFLIHNNGLLSETQNDVTSYFLFNLKLNFSKKKDKKVKAIKKRLRKKILLDFVAFARVKQK